jgi:hypothetical protein
MSLRPSFLLPAEDPVEFERFFAALQNEYQPQGPTESFLVHEIAESQWKLRRIAPVEGDLLQATGAHYLADAYAKGCDHLLKLSRYESTLRRNWYRAVKELRVLRREKLQARQANEASPHVDRSKPIPATSVENNSKPMPEPLARELAAHRVRNPLFDPHVNANEMSKALRNWLREYPATASATPRPSGVPGAENGSIAKPRRDAC